MSRGVSRRVTQHLAAARSLAVLANDAGDQHIKHSLITAALLQLELTLSFYVVELVGVGAEPIYVPSLSAVGLSDQLNGLGHDNAKEFAQLMGRPESGLAQLFAWLCLLRTVDGKQFGIANPLFATDEFESGSSLIASSAEKGEFVGMPSPVQLQQTIDVIRDMIYRQRIIAEEY